MASGLADQPTVPAATQQAGGGEMGKQMHWASNSL